MIPPVSSIQGAQIEFKVEGGYQAVQQRQNGVRLMVKFQICKQRKLQRFYYSIPYGRTYFMFYTMNLKRQVWIRYRKWKIWECIN